MSCLNLCVDSFHSAVLIVSCPCCRCRCCAPEWSDQTHGTLRQQAWNSFERIENKRDLDRGGRTCGCLLASVDLFVITSYLFCLIVCSQSNSWLFKWGYGRSAWPNDSWPHMKHSLIRKRKKTIYGATCLCVVIWLLCHWAHIGTFADFLFPWLI